MRNTVSIATHKPSLGPGSSRAQNLISGAAARAALSVGETSVGVSKARSRGLAGLPCGPRAVAGTAARADRLGIALSDVYRTRGGEMSGAMMSDMLNR